MAISLANYFHTLLQCYLSLKLNFLEIEHTLIFRKAYLREYS